MKKYYSTEKNIKTAIYKYLKALNKIEFKKYNFKKSALKLQNDFDYNFAMNLNAANVNYMLKLSQEKILIFL